MQHSGFDLFGTFEEPSAEACGRVALENRKQSTHPLWKAEERQDTMLSTPPPPPPPPTKLPWREAALTPHKRLFDSRNSVGVRHHCGRADRRLGHVHHAGKTAIAEDALREYRNAGGNYVTLRRLDPTSDNTYGQFGSRGIGPYLPIDFGSDARNILGGQINFRNLGDNMMMTYSGFSSYEKCRRVLEHFGEIIEDDHHGSSIRHNYLPTRAEGPSWLCTLYGSQH